ncbi:MAG: phosphotransferase, partial [Lachnospiraceae bacterium]|nr:phosphotransferase [Lachnospiraceae bacterium]
MMYLPKAISDFLSSAQIEPEHEGMSSADVFRCRISSGGREELYYMKTESWSRAVENEHCLYRWLYEKKRLPVPEPLFCVKSRGASKEGAERGYLLIRAAKGEILRKPKYYADPVRLAGLAAEGIRLLRQVDFADCPVRADLDEKLKLAEERLRCGSYGELDP